MSYDSSVSLYFQAKNGFLAEKCSRYFDQILFSDVKFITSNVIVAFSTNVMGNSELILFDNEINLLKLKELNDFKKCTNLVAYNNHILCGIVENYEFKIDVYDLDLNFKTVVILELSCDKDRDYSYFYIHNSLLHVCNWKDKRYGVPVDVFDFLKLNFSKKLNELEKIETIYFKTSNRQYFMFHVDKNKNYYVYEYEDSYNLTSQKWLKIYNSKRELMKTFELSTHHHGFLKQNICFNNNGQLILPYQKGILKFY